ncbi:hypothetical protein L6241_16145 [Janibacter sp. Y6]|uniref:hypothetical protein n=1 Tax=Janibacter sp. Y6 TaxID=2913552 RepID=UPI0034A0D937
MSAGAGSAAAPASADVVPSPDRNVIGGCLLRFDGAGQPYLSPSLGRPCIGAVSITRTGLGDLEIHLAPGARYPQTRLLVSADTTLASRGITVGASRSPRSIALRFFDSRSGKRVDMRSTAQRARVARGGASVGWLGRSAVNTTQLDPGVDAYGRFHDRLATDDQTVAGGCVIRFSSTGPKIHANSTHHCTGVRSVGISTLGRMRIVYSDEQRGSTINVSADPDETLVRRGIITGISSSPAELHVDLFDARSKKRVDLRRLADRKVMAGAFANIWVAWTKTTTRPGLANATTTPALDKYGQFVHGSAPAGGVRQTGCEIRFGGTGAHPSVTSTSTSSCTGAASVSVGPSGTLRVVAAEGTSGPIIATTTVSSRSAADYGIRAGASGGGATTDYRFYSIRLARTLDLRKAADRDLFRRTNAAVVLGWSRPAPPTNVVASPAGG